MPHTPPPSPTSSRDAACYYEYSRRVMGSPENHHIPTGPLIPSTFTHSFRVQPTNLSTQLSSIPSHNHQNGPHTSTSAPTLAPAPIITSMAPPPLPSHRQTLTSAQLTAAYAALPPLNPPQSRLRHTSIPSINQHLSRGPSANLATQPSSIPLQHHQNTLPPPPVVTSIAALAPSSHRQTLTFSQLSAAYIALPSLNPQSRFRPQVVSVYHVCFMMLLTKI